MMNGSAAHALRGQPRIRAGEQAAKLLSVTTMSTPKSMRHLRTALARSSSDRAGSGHRVDHDDGLVAAAHQLVQARIVEMAANADTKW